MGSFGGHALPGSFFIIYAVWWTVQMFRRYFSSRVKPAASSSSSSSSFQSSATFPMHELCCCGPSWLRHWEWEGFLKVFFTLVGFVGEVITAMYDGRFVHMGNGQHATMFFFFGMSGVVDILVHHRAPLPQDIQYLVGCLAFVVEAVLFMFHLHGRTQMDVLIHTLLVYVIYANIIIVVLEIRYRHSIAVALSRAYSVFLQGTWFWQAGFLLYNPLPGAVAWRGDDHDQMMVVTMMFAWHMAGVLVVMLCIGAVVAACQTRRRPHQHQLPLLRRSNGDAMTPAAAAAAAAGGGGGDCLDDELDSDVDSVQVDLTRHQSVSATTNTH